MANHMQKTTLSLDAEVYRRLKALATLDLRHFGAVELRGAPTLLPRDL